ncbi:adenylate/guanylate cyclase domain-containing protein [Candidatus Riflebacteria bacterium]
MKNAEKELTVQQSVKHLVIAILMLPFLILSFHHAYFDLIIIAISRQEFHNSGELLSFLRYGSAQISLADTYTWILGFLLVYAWALPIFRFVQDINNETLKKIVREKFEKVTLNITGFIFVLFLFDIILHLVQYWKWVDLSVFFWYLLPAYFINKSFLWIFSLIYVNTTFLTKHINFYRHLYSEEEIYRPKPGYQLNTWNRILLLLFFNNLIPLGAIAYLLWKNGYQLNKFYGEIVFYSIYFSIIITIIALGFILKGFWRPINELLKKMKQVGSGNLDVKTTIFSNDDVAQIKNQFNLMVDGLKDRENIKEMFGRYLSFEIAKKLLDSEKINLGGDEIEAAVLFCDIRNFTTMSEKMSPAEVVKFLNHYFSYVTEPILEEKGVINKFIGDAIMAVFSPIFGVESYADSALRASLGMREKLKQFNLEFPEYEAKFGVGLHCGPLIAGNVGTKERLEYTVIGDTVNASARIESQTKEFIRDILLSLELFEKLSPELKGKVEFENMGKIKVKGKSVGLELFYPGVEKDA